MSNSGAYMPRPKREAPPAPRRREKFGNDIHDHLPTTTTSATASAPQTAPITATDFQRDPAASDVVAQFSYGEQFAASGGAKARRRVTRDDEPLNAGVRKDNVANSMTLIDRIVYGVPRETRLRRQESQRDSFRSSTMRSRPLPVHQPWSDAAAADRAIPCCLLFPPRSSRSFKSIGDKQSQQGASDSDAKRTRVAH